MANARYWRAAILGSFTSGTWQGEVAQTGISGICVDGGGDFPPVILNTLPTFTANPSADVGTWSKGTVEYGSVGPGRWTKANQDALADALWAFANSIKPFQSNLFSWQEIRVAAVQADGTYVNGASIYTISSPLSGGLSTAPDVTKAACVSLRSGGRSPRARGRMFVPYHQAVTAEDASIIPTVQQDALMLFVEALVNGTTVLPGQFSSAIVSRTGLVYSNITEVRIGDEFDRQQSRRRQRREVYRALPVT